MAKITFENSSQFLVGERDGGQRATASKSCCERYALTTHLLALLEVTVALQRRHGQALGPARIDVVSQRPAGTQQTRIVRL